MSKKCTQKPFKMGGKPLRKINPETLPRLHPRPTTSMFNLNTIEHDADENNSEIGSSTPKPILRHQRRHSIARDKNVSFDLDKNRLHVFIRDDDGFSSNLETEVVTNSIHSSKKNPEGSESSDLFTTDLSAIEKVDGSGQSNLNGDVDTSTIEAVAIVCDKLTPKTTSIDVQRDCSISEDVERKSSGAESAHGCDGVDSPVTIEADAIPNSINNDVERNCKDSEISGRNKCAKSASGCDDIDSVDSSATIGDNESEIGHSSDDNSSDENSSDENSSDDNSSADSDEEPVKQLWSQAKLPSCLRPSLRTRFRRPRPVIPRPSPRIKKNVMAVIDITDKFIVTRSLKEFCIGFGLKKTTVQIRRLPQLEGETLLGVAAQDNKQPQPARITARRTTVAVDKKATLDEVLNLVLPPVERAVRIERDEQDERAAREVRGEKPAQINRRRMTHHTDETVSNIADIISCELGGELSTLSIASTDAEAIMLNENSTEAVSITPKPPKQSEVPTVAVKEQDEPLDLTMKASQYCSPKIAKQNRPRCVIGESNICAAPASPSNVVSEALKNQIAHCDQSATRAERTFSCASQSGENQLRRSLPVLIPISSSWKYSLENNESAGKKKLDDLTSNVPNLAEKPSEWLKYWKTRINQSDKSSDAIGVLSDRTNTQKY